MRKFLMLMLIISISSLLYCQKTVATMEEFGKPEQMIFGNGYLYIVEGTSIYIYKDSDFTFVKQFGKSGEGPGELKKNPFGGPILVSPYKGKIYISNTSKMSIFSDKGDFIEEKKVAGFDMYAPVAEDKFYCLSNAKKDGEDVLAIYLADKNMKKLKVIHKSDFITGRNVRFDLPLNQMPPTPFKEKLFIPTSSKEFVIKLFDLDGNLVKTIKKDIQSPSVPADYKEKTFEWLKKTPPYSNALSFFKSRITFKKKFPSIHFMLTDNDKLYLFTFKMKGENRECIVMDANGKILKTTYLPFPYTYAFEMGIPTAVHKGHFYQLRENIDDETWELKKSEI